MMENLIATVVFILPGFMAYFWIQSFGRNPVVKHSPVEFTTIAALLWVPVSVCSLMTYNIFALVLHKPIVWSIPKLQLAAQCVGFIVAFLLISAVSSYLVSVIWVRRLQPIVDDLINSVRQNERLAPLSKLTTVWEEFAIRIDDAEDIEEKIAVLKIYKIDKPENFVVGSMTKGARPNEKDKALVLEEMEAWRESVEKHYNYPVKRAYVDVKTGVIIEELDRSNPTPKHDA